MNIINKIINKLRGSQSALTPPDPRWIEVKKRLKESKRIIDLGCGNNPVQGAQTAVDLYIEPAQRLLGAKNASAIDLNKMKEKGINFINSRIDAKLPFADKEFDFAYSSHVFEHLDDPKTACIEMIRIAKSGVIITPAIFTELAFGRPYHKWLVMDRGNKLLFLKKRPFEDRPFGETPKWDAKKQKYIIYDKTNPFDMLLNDEAWYKGQFGNMPRLSNSLRQEWYSHSPLIEVIFIWDNNFTWEIYD